MLGSVSVSGMVLSISVELLGCSGVSYSFYVSDRVISVMRYVVVVSV